MAIQHHLWKKKSGRVKIRNGNLLTLREIIEVMKPRFIIIKVLGAVFLISSFYSCQKQSLFQSEKDVKNRLQGTWYLIPIPRFDIVNGNNVEHIENWTFDDTKVTIINVSQTGTSTYSVNTTFSKAEFKLDGVTPAFTYPSRVREINGTWRIIQLKDDILIIGNNQDGASGLIELEFHK